MPSKTGTLPPNIEIILKIYERTCYLPHSGGGAAPLVGPDQDHLGKCSSFVGKGKKKHILGKERGREVESAFFLRFFDPKARCSIR